MLYAYDLKKMYGVYGHFYYIKLGEKEYACRSTLEIIHHDITPLAINDILTLKPELLVIMMNPGGSKPRDSSYRPVKIKSIDKLLPTKELAPAIPDATQYQIMRVMAAMNIRHSRIVNLSDLREAKSGIFVKTMGNLANLGYPEHSIFDKKRHAELTPLLGIKKLRILVGWGRDAALLPSARLCLKQLGGRPVFGVPVDDKMELFAHPSPMLQTMKDKWLSAILKQFDNTLTNLY